MLTAILSFLGQMLSSIFSEVLKDVLKTPAVTERTVSAEGTVTVAADTDSIADRYQWMRDRG